MKRSCKHKDNKNMIFEGLVGSTLELAIVVAVVVEVLKRIPLRLPVREEDLPILAIVLGVIGSFLPIYSDIGVQMGLMAGAVGAGGYDFLKAVIQRGKTIVRK